MPIRISKYWVLVQFWSCHVWQDVGLFLRLLLFCGLFVLRFYCCYVFCVLFLLLCCLFTVFVQVYRPLPQGGNSVAINKYHISIDISQARGLKDRHPFTQRVLHQATYVRLHLTSYSASQHFYDLKNVQRYAMNTQTWTPVPTIADT